MDFRAAMIGIFLSVDRSDVRRIPAEIGPPDAELLAVGIDPFPERFTGGQTLGPRRAIDADDIGRQPMAIASAQAAAVIGPVVGSLEAAGNRLAIVIAEGAGDARRQARRLGDVKHVK